MQITIPAFTFEVPDPQPVSAPSTQTKGFYRLQSFGNLSNSTINNGELLRSAITQLQAGETLLVPAGVYECDPFECSVPNISVIGEKETHVYFSSLAGLSNTAISVSASGISFRCLRFSGSSSAYIALQHCFHLKGTTVSTISDILFDEIEIDNFGSLAIYGEFNEFVDVTRSRLHHCGYGGVMLVSPKNCNITKSRMYTFAGASGSLNAYPISLTHHPDPNMSGERSDTNHFPIDCRILYNTISDCPWDAIDGHGGIGTVIAYNNIFATRMGISASSDGAGLVGGQSNMIVYNNIDARNQDGSPSGYEHTGQAITVNGGTVKKQRATTVAYNTCSYKGIAGSGYSGSILIPNNENIAVEGNRILNFKGNGIYAHNTSGKIKTNVFKHALDAQAICILDDSMVADKLEITENRYEKGTDTIVCAAGVRQVNNNSGKRPLFSGNDFSAATIPFLIPYGRATGTDVTPIIRVTSATTATIPVDLSDFDGYDAVVETNVTTGATLTISGLNNGKLGQKITFVNIGLGTVVLSRSFGYFPGSTNLTMVGPNKVCVVTKIGTYWAHVTSSLTNG